MENKTTEKKNISPKAPCEFCGKIGALSNIKNHQKTKLCLESRGSGSTPKNSPKVNSRYQKNNQKKKEKLIATLGEEGLRERQRLAKAAYRLKLKQKQGDTKQENEVKLTENPTLNKELKDFLPRLENTRPSLSPKIKKNNILLE